jgi:predicted SAM-dependent methyltransferase
MKLHIGPGKTYIPGWINVDIFSNVRADLCSSALALPYPSESCDIIYASHVLEHFNRHTVLAALGHWKHLLKIGGILRLSVPDFAAIVEHYNKHLGLEILLGLLYGGQNFLLNHHCIIFDQHTLVNALQKVGFLRISNWDWRDTEHSEYDDYSQAYLPFMDKTNGLLMSLNLEAIKDSQK